MLAHTAWMFAFTFNLLAHFGLYFWICSCTCSLITRLLPQSNSWRGILMPYYVGNCSQWTKTRRRWQALKRNAFKFVKPRLWQDMARCVRSLVCSHILFVLWYVCSLIRSFTCLCIDLFVNRSPVCSCLSVRSSPLRSILDLVMPCPYLVDMC